jgi:hypothetical protein
MEEKKAQKAFGIDDSRAMLDKLRWELENIFTRQRHDIRVCQYHAFNCAITAWHATDWLWEDMPPDLKHEMEWKKPEHFQVFVCEQSPELCLCRQIANGSKHCRLRSFDPAVSAVISDGQGYDYGNPIIIDGDVRHDASYVFGLALCWLEQFIRSHNILLEEK